MKLSQYQEISHLEGLEFVKSLLRCDEQRFDQSEFCNGSTFEDINNDFGIFPKVPLYPVYFAGDIREPFDKIIFMGINPVYNAARNQREQVFLKTHGLFEGYCRIFAYYSETERKRELISYYTYIAEFLKRYYDITEEIIDWNWFQQRVTALELVPYHTAKAAGLRINDPRKYRDVYLQIIVKLLQHLNPKRPIFINGFPTYRNLIKNKAELRSEFHVIKEVPVNTKIAVAIGILASRCKFIGLPFLNWRIKRELNGIIEAAREAQTFLR